jgi:hypothetical protein
VQTEQTARRGDRPAPVRTRADVRFVRLPDAAHSSRPWRVHELTDDFELEDVWALPTPGGPDDLARFLQLVASQDAHDRDYPAVFRALFALRWKLGALLGWDSTALGIGERVPSLRARLPADLLAGPRGPDLRAVPGRVERDGPPIFNSVYLTHDEWVAELANGTVHSLMHIGWVPDDSGGLHHAQMAVLTKPNGWFGKAYMAAIKPFRHALIYPMQARAIERRWQSPGRVRRVSVTEPIAVAGGHDYADSFELCLTAPDRFTPEEWLRAGVEATPAWIKRAAGHADGLDSARIVESDAELVVLEASDPLMRTVLIGRNVEPERRILTTVLRYKRPRLARAVWALLGILHRRTAPRIVAGGVREEDDAASPAAR